MKKLLSIIIILVNYVVHGQGTLNVYNYSPYKLEYHLLTNNPTNIAGNCAPNIETYINAPYLMPDVVNGTSVTYTSYNQAFNPSFGWYNGQQITAWVNYSTGLSYAGPAPVLNIFSGLTKWLGSKFSVRDATTNNPIAGGAFSQIGGISCGATNSFIGAVGGIGYPIAGQWFEFAGETFFIVE